MRVNLLSVSTPWEWSDREMNTKKNHFIIRATITEEENRVLRAQGPNKCSRTESFFCLFVCVLEQMCSRSYHVGSVSGPW